MSNSSLSASWLYTMWPLPQAPVPMLFHCEDCTQCDRLPPAAGTMTALKLRGKEPPLPSLGWFLSISCHRNEKSRSYEVLIKSNHSIKNFPHLQQCFFFSHQRGKTDCYWHVLFTRELATLYYRIIFNTKNKSVSRVIGLSYPHFLHEKGKLETDLMTSPRSFIELVTQLREQVSFKQV